MPLRPARARRRAAAVHARTRSDAREDQHRLREMLVNEGHRVQEAAQVLVRDFRRDSKDDRACSEVEALPQLGLRRGIGRFEGARSQQRHIDAISRHAQMLRDVLAGCGRDRQYPRCSTRGEGYGQAPDRRGQAGRRGTVIPPDEVRDRDHAHGAHPEGRDHCEAVQDVNAPAVGERPQHRQLRDSPCELPADERVGDELNRVGPGLTRERFPGRRIREHAQTNVGSQLEKLGDELVDVGHHAAHPRLEKDYVQADVSRLIHVGMRHHAEESRRQSVPRRPLSSP